MPEQHHALLTQCLPAKQHGFELVHFELLCRKLCLLVSNLKSLQAQLAAEEVKLNKLKAMFFGRPAADAAARAERDAAQAKVADSQQLIGQAAMRISSLEARLEEERQRALTEPNRAAQTLPLMCRLCRVSWLPWTQVAVRFRLSVCLLRAVMYHR